MKRFNGISKLLFVIFFTLIVAVFVSCEDDNSAIGTDLMPSSDIMVFDCDTINVECYTLKDSHVETQNRTVSPVGIINDPIFGKTKASCFFQTSLSSNNVTFENVVDINDPAAMNKLKLILYLKCSRVYGNASSTIKFNIHRLKKDIYYDSIYYDDTRLQSSDYQLLTSVNSNFDFATDSIMKIELPKSLADSIVIQNEGDTIWENSEFLSFFKGLYITCDDISDEGCIYVLDLIGNKSKMVLEYDDNKSFEFNIDEYSARANLYEHDYTLGCEEVNAALANPEATSQYCFIQGLGGLKTKIKFPELKTLFDSTNIVINKAQLKLVAKAGSVSNTLTAPSGLSITRILDSGLFDFIEDYKSNSKFFGGSLDETDNTYTFNIPLHIQSLENGENDNGILIISNDNRIYPDRAMFYGNTNDAYSLKLEIYYSKY